MLHPRGMFVPTQMIFSSQLPPALFITWLQVRSLAWVGTRTPVLCLSDLAALTGKSVTTLTRHLEQLQRLHTLRISAPQQGRIILSFPARLDLGRRVIAPFPSTSRMEDCGPATPQPSRSDDDSGNQATPGWQPAEGMLPALATGEEQETELDPLEVAKPPTREGDEQTGEGKNELDENTRTLQSPQVSIYRDLIHLTPNPAQRRLLCARVTDLEGWELTLEHWVGHGWNPRNLTGMLELYSRGGARGCRYCHPGGTTTTASMARTIIAGVSRRAPNRAPARK
jgi:hypothetical protein